MSVLVFTECSNGKVRKASLEAVNYASHIAGQTGGTVTAIIDSSDKNILGDLGRAGAAKVLVTNDARLNAADAMAWTAALAQAVEKESAQIIIFPHDLAGKAIAPRLAARLKAGVVAGAVEYPNTDGGFTVRKNAFSGKATAVYAMHSDKKIITLLPNTFQVKLGDGNASVEDFTADIANVPSPIVIKDVKKTVSATLPLPEAELVVSAGRGMKGPENWGMIEDLAKSIGATTACSRPVADMGWRPHHEHVGQTGIAIRPNLYIAIGISGAIQHLAGVNGSKTIVVINSDPEAPFFKAADYGIVGNAFEIVPALTEAFKKFKAAQH